MTYPYPTVVREPAGAGTPPPETRYLTGRLDAANFTVTAVYGGQQLMAPALLSRAKVVGPPGTTCTIYIAESDVGDARERVDRTPFGSDDYAHWDPPLVLPAGGFLLFVWEHGIIYPAVVLLGASPLYLAASARVVLQALPGG